MSRSVGEFEPVGGRARKEDNSVVNMADLLSSLVAALSASVTLTHKDPVDVTDSSAAILAANPNRKIVILQNISDEIIDIKFGVTAVVGAGLRIYPGATVEVKLSGLNLDTRSIFGIHGGTGNKVLLITEGE